MIGLWQRLKQRKLVQWSLAYIAFAFALIQVIDVVADSYDWPHLVMHLIFGVLTLGFIVTLVLAWYHGERGAQHVSGPELLLIALALAIGGGLLWHFGRAGSSATPVKVAATRARSLDGAQRYPGTAAQDSAAVAATPPDTAAIAAGSGLRVAPVSAVVQAKPIPAKSIAVLPFENLSSNKENAYFADGMQDLILTKLSDIGGLKVVSRTSTENYSSHPGDLGAIGQRLGVATFLEGTVQKSGKQVLINVQLIDAKTDDHIWAQSYTRTLDNIFGVEGEVAGKVADALNAKLTSAESAAVAHVPTTNPQAYDDYLRGLHFDNEAEKGDWATAVPQAIAAYGKAVREDPGFALAWAALSGARAGAFYVGTDRSMANLKAAEAAAKRALQLDPKLPDAHEAMAGVERFLHHDLVAAHDQMQQAVDLRPNDANALANLAISAGNLGDSRTARKAMRRAVALDPTDAAMQYHFGQGLASHGDYAEARRAEHRALAINPQFAQAYIVLSQIDISQNLDVASATRVMEQMAPGTPVNVAVVRWRIDLLLFGRQFDTARVLAEKYSGQFKTGPAALDMAFARARIEWLAGKTDDARAFYRTAMALATKSSAETDIDAFDHARLGLAYARLGDAGAARKESDRAFAIAVKTHKPDLTQGVEYALAESQLALGNKSAAIDSLTRVLAMKPDDLRAPWLLFLARMQLDPVWDPVRKDPRFQALLKQYVAAPTRVTATPSTPREPDCRGVRRCAARVVHARSV
jgi:serine/threonine-protein kinase